MHLTCPHPVSWSRKWRRIFYTNTVWTPGRAGLARLKFFAHGVTDGTQSSACHGRYKSCRGLRLEARTGCAGGTAWRVGHVAVEIRHKAACREAVSGDPDLCLEESRKPAQPQPANMQGVQAPLCHKTTQFGCAVHTETWTPG